MLSVCENRNTKTARTSTIVRSSGCGPCVCAFHLFLVLQEEFDKDLIPIEESFKPLVLKCKELGRAMRIGTNHGSLSARVLSYYGDTPRGMVESAVEFANICRCVVGLGCVTHGKDTGE